MAWFADTCDAVPSDCCREQLTIEFDGMLGMVIRIRWFSVVVRVVASMERHEEKLRYDSVTSGLVMQADPAALGIQ